MAEADTATPAEPTIAIVGGGIMGASVAYYLALKGRAATVYEATSVAAAASGKAGGFLARDWCATPVDKLAARSFNLHKQLAQDLPVDIGYRSIDAYSVSLVHKDAANTAPGRGKGAAGGSNTVEGLKWIDNEIQVVGKTPKLGSSDACAQVTPPLLTRALMAEAQQRAGTTLRHAIVEHVTAARSVGGGGEPPARWQLRVLSTEAEGEEGEETSKSGTTAEYADVVIICMGPWSIQASGWFPSLAPVVAQKAASIVVHGTSSVSSNASVLFSRYTDPAGREREPEVYPRRDALYACQSAVADDLPPTAAQVAVHKRDAAELKNFARALNSAARASIDDGNFTAQACFLPISADGVPVIGKVPGADGVFVATGHSCWGILNAPATGCALADLVVDGESKHFDLSPFSPARFSRQGE